MLPGSPIYDSSPHARSMFSTSMTTAKPEQVASAECSAFGRDQRLLKLKQCLQAGPLSASEIAVEMGLKYCQVAWLLKTTRGSEIHISDWTVRGGIHVALYGWGLQVDAATPPGHIGPAPVQPRLSRFVGRRIIPHVSALPAKRCSMVAMLFGHAQC